MQIQPFERVAAKADSLVYRADIDGLRAVAVLLVLAYHFDIPPVSGGYIGVDVFFVISGFLITSLLAPERSLRAALPVFYARRIKRLLPMLLAVAGLTTAVAAFFLLPDDFVRYLRSAYFALFFQSNSHFAGEISDYFAANAHELPLLHTWSLAVEWQFYFIFPAFFLLVRKRLSPQRTTWVLSLLALALALYSVYAASASSSYFSTTARLFELLFGAVVARLAWQPGTAVRRGIVAASLAGLAMLACLYSPQTVFPGANAVLVCLLAAAIVFCGKGDPLLSGRWLVHVGKISYSAYLWHWPAVAFLAYLHIDLPLPGRLAVIVLVLGLSHYSHRFIETPGRRLGFAPLPAVLLLVVLPLVASRGLFLLAAKYDGFPSRLGDEAARIQEVLRPYADKSRHNCSRQKERGMISSCSFGGAETGPLVFLLGDSHANSHRWFTEVLAQEAGARVLVRSYGACLMLPGVDHGYRKTAEEAARCAAAASEEYAEIRRLRPRFVVLAQRWDNLYPIEELAKLENSVREIIDSGATPVIVSQTAEGGADMKSCFYQHIKLGERYDGACVIRQDSPEARGKRDLMEKLFRKVRDRHPQALVIDLKELQCASGICASAIDGIPIYDDDNHINGFGSARLAERYRERYGNPLMAKGKAAGT